MKDDFVDAVNKYGYATVDTNRLNTTGWARDDDDWADVGEETVLNVGKSMLADIDDRIEHEFGAELFGITARSSNDELGRKRFRTIPEDE